MPVALPKEFPPQGAIDHKIELVPNAKPPFWAPYWMALPMLDELRWQLEVLLNAGVFGHPRHHLEQQFNSRRNMMGIEGYA